MVDEFKKHKTLGELILIDRVTDMTSACGVVEEVHTEETGLYEGRIDRNVRAAIKGQKAIIVPFAAQEISLSRWRRSSASMDVTHTCTLQISARM